MTQLYSLRSTAAEGEYIIMKFDDDYHCQAVYALNKGMCSGPDGHRPTCKHRQMLKTFLEHKHVDDGWFYDWHTRMWRKPFAEAELKAEKAIADTLALGNGKPSETPLLGLSERSDAAHHKVLGKPKDLLTQWKEGSKLQACLGTCLTPNECILHGCKILAGRSPEQAVEDLAKAIAPAFATEGAQPALNARLRPMTPMTIVEHPTTAEERTASPVPVVAPPPKAIGAALPSGGGTIRRRKV